MNTYNSYGIEGLKKSISNKSYNVDFKLKAIKDYLTTETSYQAIAIKYNIKNPSLVARWKLDYENDGRIGLQPKKKGRKHTIPSENIKKKDIRSKQA